MPWKRASFKGQQVWALVTAEGVAEDDGGRIPIRYSRSEGATIYRASADRVSLGSGPVDDLPPGRVAEAASPSTPAAKSPSSRASGFGSAGTRTKAQADAARSAASDLVASFSASDAVCFTDGACKGNPGPAGAGAVVRLPNGTLLERHAALGLATNNVGELTAVGLALDLLDEARLPPQTHVQVLTDSKYAHGVLCLGWKAKANADLILGLRDRLKRRKVSLHWVAGHVGIPENERADELANRGVEESLSAR